jgi:hypothetical protein
MVSVLLDGILNAPPAATVKLLMVASASNVQDPDEIVALVMVPGTPLLQLPEELQLPVPVHDELAEAGVLKVASVPFVVPAVFTPFTR